MALKTKIGKADFDSLPEALKTEYKPDGDGYKLDADYEDVTGLKAKTAELLADLAKLKKAQKDYDGLDPAAARAALEAQQSADDERLKAAGEFEALKKKLEERHAKELADAHDRANSIIANLRHEKIANLAIAKGIKADRVKAAIAEGDLDQLLDLNESDFSVRTKDGIGDAKDVDGIFNGLKERAAWLFEATNASGSGASGSGKSNGGGSAAAVWTRDQWESASTQERTKFTDAGGKIT